MTRDVAHELNFARKMFLAAAGFAALAAPVVVGIWNAPPMRAQSQPETRLATLYMIFDRLGLKMESSKAPINMFVVEHVEKPTEN